jgi:hypothetical protein
VVLLVVTVPLLVPMAPLLALLVLPGVLLSSSGLPAMDRPPSPEPLPVLLELVPLANMVSSPDSSSTASPRDSTASSVPDSLVLPVPPAHPASTVSPELLVAFLVSTGSSPDSSSTVSPRDSTASSNPDSLVPPAHPASTASPELLAALLVSTASLSRDSTDSLNRDSTDSSLLTVVLPARWVAPLPLVAPTPR